MTTIAYRDDQLAADSCVTVSSSNDEPRSRAYERKLKTRAIRYAKIDGKIAIASSGDTGLASVDELLMEQAAKVFVSKRFGGFVAADLNVPRLLKARKELIGKKGEYEAILLIYHGGYALPYIVENSGFVNRFEPDFDPNPQGPGYYAIGSDAAVALGAMYAGATAEQAVKAASLHGVWTGGKINVIGLAGDKLYERVI